jgi:hypothetical protein
MPMSGAAGLPASHVAHVLPWAYLGTYGELSFGLTGIAVNHRVGSQLGGAKNDLVSDWASVEKFP